jgi:hypothetical protein
VCLAICSGVLGSSSPCRGQLCQSAAPYLVYVCAYVCSVNVKNNIQCCHWQRWLSAALRMQLLATLEVSGSATDWIISEWSI